MVATGNIRSLLAFCSASQANVAIAFALALVPLTLAVGAAVDYSGSIAVKASLQAAAEAPRSPWPRKGR
jgi:Flp pilus assembly protein TadG